MRQLTSLDAQFLAIEDARNYGHVSSLALYDPSTAPGGKLTVERMRELLEERIHLLPVPVEAGRGSLRPRPSLLDRGRGLRRRVPRARARAARARRRPPARRAGRAAALAPARSRAPAVGALRDPGRERRPRRCDDQDAPLRRGRDVGGRDPRRDPGPRSSGRDVRRPRSPPARSGRATWRCWAAGSPHAAPAVARPARPARHAAQPRRDTVPDAAGRRADLAYQLARHRARRIARRRCARAPPQQGSAHAVQRPPLAPPSCGLRVAVAHRGQGGEGRAGDDGQRRRREHVCRRDAALARGARRAARDATAGDDPRVRAHARAVRHPSETRCR